MFPLVLAASVIDFNAAIETQIGVRRTPLIPGQSSTTIFTANTAPQIEIAQRSERFNGRLSYTPLLAFRFPNELRLNRPLLLHQFNGEYTADLTQRTELTLLTQGSIGESDYTTTRDILGPSQATLPGDTVNDLLSLMATGGLSHKLSQVTSLVFQFGAERTQSLGEGLATVFPERTQYLGSLAIEFLQSRRYKTSFGVRTSIDDTTLPRQTMLTVVPSWLQAYQYSETGSVSLALGAAYAQTIASYGTREGDSGSVAADVAFTWEDRLVRSGRYAVIGDLSLTWQRVFDPLTLRNNPRAGAAINLVLRTPGKLAASFNASFFADATLNPQIPESNLLAGNLAETVWNISLPVTYELNRSIVLSAGGNATGIGPHWSRGNFTRETDLGLFVGLRGSWSTGRPKERVSVRRAIPQDKDDEDEAPRKRAALEPEEQDTDADQTPADPQDDAVETQPTTEQDLLDELPPTLNITP